MEPHPASRAEYVRHYRRTHPLAIALSGGIAFAGIITLLFPGSVEQSATYLALPQILRTVFNVSYFFGGSLALFGLVRAEHRYEAAGMALLASVLTVQWAAAMRIHPTASATFILFLAAGCGWRCYVLSKGEV